MPSKIEWTQETWNPVVGCRPVSEGCENCYAKRMANRLAWMGSDKYRPVVRQDGKRIEWTGKVNLASEDKFSHLHRWRKPRVVFVCSMGDLFYEEVPIRWQQGIWEMMHCYRRHRYIVLTKRSRAMADFLCSHSGFAKDMAHVWWGFTAENQEWFDRRWDDVRGMPVANRILSCEPLLGPVVLPDDFLAFGKNIGVICGGETGPGARRLKLNWVRDVRDQCLSAGVPFFLKRLGWTKDKQVDRILDGHEHNELPWVMKG